MPKHLNVQFEACAVINCITIQDTNTKTRVCASPWGDGPGAATSGSSDRVERANKCDADDKLYETGVPDDDSTSLYSVGFYVLMVR